MNSPTQLGSYEILSAIGKGGMGEVWKAKDTKLGREVAIKTLPEEFAQDTDRLARFEREAKLLASLNHPNIAAIYGLEKHEGTRFLVLELVEGDTLGEQIKRGAIPVEESLKLALQIAEALETAHEKGVIHRDLKPANIKITPEGKVKVLDFGLAKALEGDVAEASVSTSPTLSMAATQQGVILGTAAYMSPEQAKGLQADRRSDIFAFGCVLFEMLTGRMAFQGELATEILASVINQEPDQTVLQADLHPRIKELLRRCFQKQPRDRWQAVGDVRFEIEEVLSDPGGVLVQPVAEVLQARTWLKLPWGVAALLALALATTVWFLQPRPPLVSRYAITPPEGQILYTAAGGEPALSPDGRTLIYISTDAQGQIQLYRRQLDQLEAVVLNGTEGGVQPSFSLDGKRVGFQSSVTGDLTTEEIKVVPIVGGPVRSAVRCPEGGCRGNSWYGDAIVFGNGAGPLHRVLAAGGGSEPISKLDMDAGEVAQLYPEFLPNGEAVLYTSWSGSLSAARVAVLDIGTGDSQMLVAGSSPSYLPSGHLIYAFDGSLWAAPFDAVEREITGTAEVMVEGVQINSGGLAIYSASADGSLAYVPGATAPGDLPGWLNRNDGSWEVLNVDLDNYSQPRVSPDGTRIAVGRLAGTGSSIWVYENGHGLDRLTFGEIDTNPVWSPDSQQIAFFSDGGLYRKAANGTGEAELILDDTVALPYSWSTDDELIVTFQGEDTGWDVGVVRIGQSDDIESLLDTRFDEQSPALSPDGRWLAYVSNESGREEVLVRPYPDVESDRGKVSPTGGVSPIWNGASSELYYRQGFTIMSVSFESLESFGTAEIVQTGWYEQSVQRRYDVDPTGERFLMVTYGAAPGQNQSQSVVVVENWVEEVKARVPVP